MSAEVHIAGLVVWVRPEQLESARQAIAELPGADIPATDPGGKLVVVLEAGDTAGIADTTHRIHGIAGVLAANIVYHQCEDAHLIGENITHDHHST